MRCKKHPCDLSSDVGVCASCLRDRLFSVMVAQAEKQAELRQDCRRKEIQPSDFPSFPRSVSPYVSHHGRHQRFFSTPQMRAAAAVEIRDEEEERRRRRGGGKLSSLFFRIFRSRSDKVDQVPGRVTDPPESSTASPSWLSNIVPGRLKKQNRTFSVDENSVGSRPKPYRYRDRGMSPVRNLDEGENGGSTGYSSESPRRTAAAAGLRRVGGKVPAHNVHVAGMSLCLSPLIRPSPSRQWNHKGFLLSDASAGCESRTPARPRLSSAATFCKSRSRKLADFGRNIYYGND